MKLEVGQKIGIYEVLNNDSGKIPVFKTGFQSLGIPYSYNKYSEIGLFDLKFKEKYYYEP